MAESRAQPPKLLTLEEYLAAETRSPVRHEYVAGELFAFAGANLRHNLVVTNVTVALFSLTRGTQCRVVSQGQMVRVADDVVYCADALVVCNPGAQTARMLTGPCLIVEVLSRSTQHIDRREKMLAYRRLGSLRVYLVVHQERRLVEWHRGAVPERGQVDVLCVPGSLSLDDIYDGIDVDAPDLDDGMR
jgi:Uma2 family endonuclease